MDKMQKRNHKLLRRHQRVRKTVAGTPERPRLSVFRSLKHVYCQVIDDTVGKTLVSVSSVQKAYRDRFPKGGGNRVASKEIGKILAEEAKAKGITRVVFDRGGLQYHGRIKDVAEGAREGGLVF